jgi:hypothetical protein
MNVLDKIDSLIKISDLEKFKEISADIADDLDYEGFDLEDIKAYLVRELTILLG